MKQLKWGIWLLLLATTGFMAVPRTEAMAMRETRMELTAENVKAFVDGFVAEEMTVAHAPGLVVTIVYRGEVILAQGYGLADRETGRPMTAYTPLRAGSVSKPVTSAAVLQLVAAGQLDLDAPVSDYLPELPLADDFGPAATVAQLLALQGGYADTVLRTHTPEQESWQPLDNYLRDHLPARVLPPGKVYSYSSWDHALLGQAMAAVRQQPFDQVMDDVLFQPLGMAQSTFTQPLPPALAADLAQGYAYDHGRFREVPLDFVQLSPGIALVTTGADMGRFMLALLQNGVLGGEQALAAETVTGMLTRQEEVHARSRGRTYGLSEVTLGGRAVLYQDGNGIGQANRLVLAPEHELGIFLSVNHRPLGYDAGSTPAYDFIKGLSTALLETFLPAAAVEADVLPMAPAGMGYGRYVGHYRLAGTPQGDFFKLGALLDNVTVRADADGAITIGANRYREVEPLLFQSEGSPGSFVVFVENEAGNVRWLTFGGTNSYEKVMWYETTAFQMALVGFVFMVSLVFVIVMPLSSHRAWLVWAMSMLQILFLGGVAWMMFRADLILFFKTVPLTTRLLFSLPWLVGALAVVALVPTLVALWQRPEPAWVRLLFGVNTAAITGFLWFVVYWNLYWKG